MDYDIWSEVNACLTIFFQILGVTENPMSQEIRFKNPMSRTQILYGNLPNKVLVTSAGYVSGK